MNDSLSWGAHNNNKTFDAMVNDILDDNDLDMVEIENKTKSTAHKMYLPFLGNCLQYTHTFTHGNTIIIITAKKFSKPFTVYVTDPNYSTNYGVKIDSQLGDNIRLPIIFNKFLR